MSSEESSLTDTVMVEPWLPSIELSSTPVTVMICWALQLPEVNVREPDTVASLVLELDPSMTTSDDGGPINTTVNVCVVPDSDTVNEDSDKVNPLRVAFNGESGIVLVWAFLAANAM